MTEPDDSELDDILRDLHFQGHDSAVKCKSLWGTNTVADCDCDVAEAKQALIAWSERREAAARIDELKLIYWLYKENNDQSVDIKFAEAYGDRIKQLTSDRTGGGEGEA